MEHELASEEPIVSKSQRKREMQALRDLVKHIVASRQVVLEKLPVEERVIEAIVDARRMKREALRRQIHHIANLLVHADTAALRRAVEDMHLPHRQDTEAFHALEQWRDRLLTGEREPLESFIEHHPSADRQHLRQLIRNAQKELQQQKPPKSSRALFKYLRALDASDV